VFYGYFCSLLGRGINKYISTSRTHLLKDSGVTWRPHSVDSVRSVRSHFWTYMGDLYVKNNRIDDKLYTANSALKQKWQNNMEYCQKCTAREKKHQVETSLLMPKLRIKRVQYFSKNNQVNWPTGSKLCRKGSPATSQFDVNCDIVLWLCQELLPFELIEKEGFQAFNKKNIHLNLPTSPCNNSPGRCLHGFEVQSQRTTGRHCQWYYNVRWLDWGSLLIPICWCENLHCRCELEFPSVYTLC